MWGEPFDQRFGPFLIMANLWFSDQVGRNRLAVLFGQERLMVKQIDLRWTARHEEINHAFALEEQKCVTPPRPAWVRARASRANSETECCGTDPGT